MIHDGGARRDCDAQVSGRTVLVQWGVAGTYELAITTGRLKGAAVKSWRMRRQDWASFRRELGYVRDGVDNAPWSFAKAAPHAAAEKLLEQLEQERAPRAEVESEE